MMRLTNFNIPHTPYHIPQRLAATQFGANLEAIWVTDTIQKENTVKNILLDKLQVPNNPKTREGMVLDLSSASGEEFITEARTLEKQSYQLIDRITFQRKQYSYSPTTDNGGLQIAIDTNPIDAVTLDSIKTQLQNFNPIDESGNAVTYASHDIILIMQRSTVKSITDYNDQAQRRELNPTIEVYARPKKLTS